MSSKASSGSLSSIMQPNKDTEMADFLRPLRHEDSLGTRLLRNIDPEWLADHEDMLELLTTTPDNPHAIELGPSSILPAMAAQPSSALPAMGQLILEGNERRTPLSERMGRGAGHGSSDTQSTSPQDITLQWPTFLGVSPQERNPLGVREASPSIETPQRQSRASSLQMPRTSQRSERSLQSLRRHSDDQRITGLVPEVSLAARAGSLGATSLQTPYRFQARTPLPGQKALSESALISEEESEPLKEEGESEAPLRKGPGRKKRTAPILVETEDGETKFVTPAEFRKLRRRITNRLSARRMRKKHAEERNVNQNATKDLEDERNHYKQACEQMQQQLTQMETVCRRLHEENQNWKSRWSQGTSDPRGSQFMQCLGAPLEPPTPAHLRAPMQLILPQRQIFNADLPRLQSNSFEDSLASQQQQLAPAIAGMPFIPHSPAPDLSEGTRVNPLGLTPPARPPSISPRSRQFGGRTGMLDADVL